MIDVETWLPKWSNGDEDDRRGYSDEFDSLYSVLPGAPVDARLRSIAGEARIVQAPIAENEYTMVIEFSGSTGSNAVMSKVELIHTPIWTPTRRP